MRMQFNTLKSGQTVSGTVFGHRKMVNRFQFRSCGERKPYTRTSFEAVESVDKPVFLVDSSPIESQSAESKESIERSFRDVLSEQAQEIKEKLPRVRRNFILHKILETLAWSGAFVSPVLGMANLFYTNSFLRLALGSLVAWAGYQISTGVIDELEQQRKYAYGPEVEFRNLMKDKSFLGKLNADVKKI